MKTNINTNNTEKFAVICTTDRYHAARYAGFNRDGVRIHETGLTLKEAQKVLLDFYCEQAGDYFANWGLAVNDHRHEGLEACKTYNDGTRSFTYGVFKYSIVPMSEIENE